MNTWQWRQQHRTAQLGALLKTQPEVMDRAISNALASIHLGREVLRVRKWLQRAPKNSGLHHVLANALRSMSHRASQPYLAAKHARRAAKSLARLAAIDGTTTAEIQQLEVVLFDIAALLENHADYFSKRSGGQTNAQ